MKEIYDRFIKKVQLPSDLDGCWIWIAGRDRCGYGRIKYDSGMRLAHRISYQLYRGLIPEGICVCHTCDNPPCVNPNHLFLGTAADNSRDMVEKGRAARAKGEANCRVKLKEYQVLEIRRRYAEGNTTYRRLAREFGISRTTVNRVVTRQRWNHV